MSLGKIIGRQEVRQKFLKFLSFLNISSIFKFNLFKFLKSILDGNLPVFYNLLMGQVYDTAWLQHQKDWI